MPDTFAWCELMTPDLDAAEAFYQGVIVFHLR